jgi:hypothetical protein
MTLPAGQKVKHVNFALCSAEVFTWLIHQADAKGQAVGLLHRPLWVCVTAADVAYLMGINDINAPSAQRLLILVFKGPGRRDAAAGNGKRVNLTRPGPRCVRYTSR